MLGVLSDILAQSFAGEMDRVRIDILADLAGDVGLARQGNCLRGESRIGAFLNDGGDRGDKLLVPIWHLSGADAFDRAQEQAGGVGLRRLPAIETVAVMRNKRNEIGLACRGIEPDRRRKPPEQWRQPGGLARRER